MRLFDTHCHFESCDEKEIKDILLRAKEAGVESIVAIGGSQELNESAMLAERVASTGEAMPSVRYAVGYDRDQIEKPMPFIPSCVKPIAWGEIGLDYYYSLETRQKQMELFAQQLDQARSRNLPVVIHTREADEDTLALLREIPSRGIIHCYTGTPEGARAFLDAGFYVSFSGIITFRLADNVRQAAAVVPNDRILIETDSPFLAPVPMRGKKNEPSYIRYTAEFIAKARGMSAEAFAEIAYANAERAFS